MNKTKFMVPLCVFLASGCALFETGETDPQKMSVAAPASENEPSAVAVVAEAPAQELPRKPPRALTRDEVRQLQLSLKKSRVRAGGRLIFQRHPLGVRFNLDRQMRMTLGAAHLVEHQIARDLQQPGGELRAGDVPAGAFPHPDKNLLRDVFDIRVAAKHAGDCARDKGLMALDQLFKCGRIAACDQLHQANVFGVILGPRRCFWIGH